MLTNFGKYLRQIRLEHDEKLKNMADKIGVTSSYLSAVENGKRNVPNKWISKIAEIYGKEPQEIEKKVEESAKEIKIDFQDIPKQDKDLVMAFARNFSNLSNEEKNSIFKMLNGKEKD